MKHLLFVSLSCIFLYSCRKQSKGMEVSYKEIPMVVQFLKEEMKEADFALLDLGRPVVTRYKDGIFVAKVRFKNHSFNEKFVAVLLNNGIVEAGKIINWSGTSNGHINIESLDRSQKIESAIENGYIKSFHPPSLMSQGLLPEVVVVATYPSSGGINFSSWMSILSLLQNGYGPWSNLYEYTESAGGGGGGVGGNNSGSGSGLNGGNQVPYLYEEPMEVDFESQYADPAIEVLKYVICFAGIPDAGATCKMTIFTDVPVDSDPLKFFDWSNGSPGHTFIQFQKTNGSHTVTQNIGFYPESGWKVAMTPAPVTGKFVDNHFHEFNASYEMSITATQLQAGLIRMQYLANFVRYDIDDYNCTDWALDVFNEVAAPDKRLDIPRFPIPGGMAPAGTSTPQGLYLQLQSRQANGGEQAAGITIPIIGWAGASNGPCN